MRASGGTPRVVSRSPVLSSSITIHRRLIVLAVAVALPLLGLVAFSVVNQFRNDRYHALRQLRYLQQLNADRIRALLDESRQKLERLSRHESIRTLHPDRASPFLASLGIANPDFGNIRLMNAGGDLIASSTTREPAVAAHLVTTPVYRRALESPGFTVSEPYQGIVTKRWTALLGLPMLAEDGTRLGTIAMPLNLLYVAESLNLASDPEGLHVGAFHRDGTLLLHRPRPTFIGTRLPNFEQLLAALDRGQRNEIELVDADGITRTFAASPIEGTPWFSFASVPTATIYASAQRDLLEAIAATLIVLVLGSYLVSRHTRAIEQPIMKLAATARAQAAGNAEMLAPVTGPAEIAETAQAFNDMIAARRQAEASLAESERRYRTIIDQSGQMVYDLDLVSNTIKWFGTTAIPSLTGQTLEEFQHVDLARWEELIHPDDRPRATAELDAAMRHRTAFHCEYRFRHRDGSYRIVEDFGVFFHDANGQTYRMLGRMSDITARKQAESERQEIEKKLLETQKLESLGVLAGGIAHDFNNLLTAILGHTTLARHEAPPGWSGTHYLEQVEKASYRAADLCKQMLAYSGRGRFVVNHVDLNELIDETAQLLRVSISKKATLQLHLARGLPAVQADATQLRQVIMNLVINASEALEERNGNITLTTGREHLDAAYLAAAHVAGDPAPGDYVFLEVSDTGSGMSAATLARVFDPFFTTKFTGRGLGLAAVLGIVRGHHGAIKVYSEPGRGTTFKIMFPAAHGAPDASSRPPMGSEWRGSGKVLVIDDEEAVRTVAAGMLHMLGFATDLAPDGATGLELFRRDPSSYQLVLLDLTMPRMDGEETFRHLRHIEPQVRVVLMSGFNRADATSRFTGKGIAGFVQKPFGIENLTTEIRRILDR